MKHSYEILNNIRIQTSDDVSAIYTLFDKIQSSDKKEVFFLSELGKKVCREMKNNCETFEITLDRFKSFKS